MTKTTEVALQGISTQSRDHLPNKDSWSVSSTFVESDYLHRKPICRSYKSVFSTKHKKIRSLTIAGSSHYISRSPPGFYWKYENLNSRSFEEMPSGSPRCIEPIWHDSGPRELQTNDDLHNSWKDMQNPCRSKHKPLETLGSRFLGWFPNIFKKKTKIYVCQD